MKKWHGIWGKVASLLLALQFLLAGCGLSQGTGSKPSPSPKTGTQAVTPIKPPAHEATLVQKVDGPLKITMLSVGKADSILLQVDKKNYLVDTGLFEDGNTLVARLRKLGVNSLDGLFLTHPHKDHIGGAVAILNSLHVEHVYYTNVVNPQSGLMKKVKKLIEDKHIDAVLVTAPMDIPLKNGASFKVFWPEKDHLTVPGDTNVNPNSMVMRFTYQDFTMMFTGDAYTQTEAKIMSLYDAKELKSDVLKVGHHSSNTSSSMNWLRTVKPMVAVISCGNEPGTRKYPNKTVLKRLKTAGAKIYNTYDNGDITITSNGSEYAVTTEK